MRGLLVSAWCAGVFRAPAEAEIDGNELAGRRTASGERFNPSAMTAAHMSSLVSGTDSNPKVTKNQGRMEAQRLE
jgi:hypothetical protein